MAYIPPHRRHTKDDKKAPVPASLSTQRRKIIYAAGSISRWWPVGCGTIPASFRLDPVSETGGKPLILCCDCGSNQHPAAAGEKPWVSIAERIKHDLLASTLRARGSEMNKLSFVARIGKVHFDRNVSLDSIRKAAAAAAAGADSRNQVHKSFCTSVPRGYVEHIQHIATRQIRLDLESEKEYYHVKVINKSRPDSTISCKCTVAKDGIGIEIYKVELNQMRHLLVDLSCLHKDMDLRLMLGSKRRLEGMENEEYLAGIEKLIRCAVLDPAVKGGLRWSPLGKESDDRFCIVGVCHTTDRAFRGATTRLKIRIADRFHHRTSTGEVSNEVTLRLTGISNKLMDVDLDTEMIQHEVKFIWDHFLTYST